MRHGEADIPHIAADSLQGRHSGRTGERVGSEGDLDLSEQRGGHAKTTFMGHQAHGCLVVLCHEGEGAIAGKIGPPEFQKGRRRHCRKFAFRSWQACNVVSVVLFQSNRPVVEKAEADDGQPKEKGTPRLIPSREERSVKQKEKILHQSQRRTSGDEEMEIGRHRGIDRLRPHEAASSHLGKSISRTHLPQCEVGCQQQEKGMSHSRAVARE